MKTRHCVSCGRDLNWLSRIFSDRFCSDGCLRAYRRDGAVWTHELIRRANNTNDVDELQRIADLLRVEIQRIEKLGCL